MLIHKTEEIFLELLSYTASVDSEFQAMFTKMKSNASYTSPEVQNELINISAKQIRSDIARMHLKLASLQLCSTNQRTFLGKSS